MSTMNTPNIDITCEDIEELLPLHALGLLDDGELALVDAHVAICPECLVALQHYEAVTGAMPSSLPPVTPDPMTKARLMDQIEPRERPVPVAEVTPIAAARSRRWSTLAAIAAALVLMFGGGYLLNRMAEQRDEAQAQAALLQEFMSPQSQVMVLDQQPASEYDWGWGSSMLMKNPQGNMMLMVEDCPPTTDDRTYIAWIAKGDHSVPVGEVIVGDDGRGWIAVSFPEDMPAPEVFGVSVAEGSDPLVDLFLRDMTG